MQLTWWISYQCMTFCSVEIFFVNVIKIYIYFYDVTLLFILLVLCTLVVRYIFYTECLLLFRNAYQNVILLIYLQREIVKVYPSELNRKHCYDHQQCNLENSCANLKDFIIYFEIFSRLSTIDLITN